MLVRGNTPIRELNRELGLDLPEGECRPRLNRHTGQALVQRQVIRHKLVDMATRVETARSFVYDLAWRLHLTPGTVARAYQLATQEGLLADWSRQQMTLEPDAPTALVLQLQADASGVYALPVGIAMRPEGREVVKRLVRTADVVVANLPHPTLVEMGIDYQSLKAIKDDIILTIDGTEVNESFVTDIRAQSEADALFGLFARIFQHRAGKYVLGFRMSRHAEAGNINADHAHAIDCFRQKLQRHAARSGHT